MSTKHLHNGSDAPVLVPDQIRLYSMRFCPFAHRVHLVLESKKIPYDVVFINLSNKPEWFLKKNPLGKIPCIELSNGEILYESLIIADYLNEACQSYVEWNLYPTDPLLKAKDRLLIEKFTGLISLLYRFFVDHFINNELFDEVLNGLNEYNRELAQRGTPFFGGNEPGMLDLMIWPWFERADIIRILKGEQYNLLQSKFLRLCEWKVAMEGIPAVQKHYLKPEIHAEYMKSHVAGSPNFDIHQ